MDGQKVIRLYLTVNEVMALRDALIHAERANKQNEPKFREYEVLFKQLGDVLNKQA